MLSERESMIAGELYDPLDPELVVARERARDICQALNATRESETAERRRLLVELFGVGGDTVWMQPPFYCDFGIGSRSVIGSGSVVTRDIPDGVFAAGNPCRVIREIGE